MFTKWAALLSNTGAHIAKDTLTGLSFKYVLKNGLNRKSVSFVSEIFIFTIDLRTSYSVTGDAHFPT